MEFISGVIRAHAPARVLDIGCGTGTELTAPLARRFPEVSFVGMDSDAASIAFARAAHPLPNIEFRSPSDALQTANERFDVVIASEVLEHVEDPSALLRDARARLSATGALVLTVPNGYGPYELMSLVEDALDATGVYSHLRSLKRRLRRAQSSSRPSATHDCAQAEADTEASLGGTLAHSPHRWFFTLARLRGLLRFGGWRIDAFRSRTFLCGFLLDYLVSPGRAAAWNARVADVLPAWCASDWMFQLRKEERGDIEASLLQPDALTVWRRALKDRRGATRCHP